MISTTFQHHFKICFCGFYMKKTVAFTLISFTVLKWDDYLSVQLPFELAVQIPVQLLLELGANWLDQNVNELEFELSRMYMKWPTHWIAELKNSDFTISIQPERCMLTSILELERHLASNKYVQKSIWVVWRYPIGHCIFSSLKVTMGFKSLLLQMQIKITNLY